ncbi:MAG: hypothetical protein II949_04960 [Prevotella sp.]|nr:hypothetical protein [Prevotella sp.]
MVKQKYELSLNGINKAIGDFVKSNWKDFCFNGIDKERILGLENVQIFTQIDFMGGGDYRFQGDIRPMINDNNGGYTITNMRIEGIATISIESNELVVKSINNHER